MGKFFVNVEAVVWRDGRLLTIERGAEESFGAGWLAFPGGKVDWNGDEAEIVERTASRELLEEVGLVINGAWYFVESKSFGIGSDPVLDLVMLSRYESGEASIISSGEVAEVSWMTVSEIRDDPRTQPWTLETLVRLEKTLRRLRWEHGPEPG